MSLKEFLRKFAVWQLGLMVYVFCGLIIAVTALLIEKDINYWSKGYFSEGFIFVYWLLFTPIYWLLHITSITTFIFIILAIFGVMGIIMGLVLKRFYQKKEPQKYILILLASCFVINLIISVIPFMILFVKIFFLKTYV